MVWSRSGSKWGKSQSPTGPFAGSSLRENRQVGLGPWKNLAEKDPDFCYSCKTVFR